MCGRFVSTTGPDDLARQFEVDEVRTGGLEPRWNVAPTLDVYAVIARDGHRRLGTLRWGLVPFWTKRLKGARAPINARVETIDDNRMFARAFERHRCIIPADGFYEWRERESGPKQPWYIHDPDGAPLALAGIWGAWRDPEAGDDAEPLFSCAILTSDAQGELADLHDRMPVMLPPRLWDEWLTADADDAPHLRAAIAALGAPALEAYPVSDRVNKVDNEGPDLIALDEVS